MSHTAVANTTTAFGALDTTSALRPLRFHCPNCRRHGGEAPVLASRAAGKLDFHHCAQCAGAWFQNCSVDEALRAAGSGHWPAAAVAPSPAETASDWKCPCCQGALVNVHDHRGSGAVVHRCLVCYGGWIEFPDLVKAADGSPDVLSRVGRFVRKLIPR